MSQDRVRRELAHVAQSGEAVSLYLHIPFCRSVCAYCGCNVIPTRDQNRGVRYVDQLATELALVSGWLHASPVTEIARGGGSPNFLAPQQLRTLLHTVDRYFSSSPETRRSIELDPRNTTSAQLETLANLGFRSLSMGVQDFSEAVQDAIRRHQSVVQTRWLVERARACGFDDINIDIVYGLPFQTEPSFLETLTHVLALAPDRVALFGYAHLPDKLPRQRLVERAGRVLDRYERASLLLLAIEQFERAGYVHLGLDHFAKPGSRLAVAARERRMTRTFQGYVEHRADTVIGVGTSAISSTPRMYWQNHAELAAWERDISSQDLPIDRGYVLDEDDQTRGAVIRTLMCNGEVDLQQIATDCKLALDPEAYFALELEVIRQMPDLASYDREHRRITTTPMGRLLVRNVCMAFDRYFDPATKCYSTTI